jgi:DNA-binding transcriptional ArsR family regulator
MQTPEALGALERFGTALADPTRRHILLLLLDGPSYPGDLLAEIATSQSNLSNHLACLRGCGLVSAQREGRRVRYELASDALAHALSDLVTVELQVGEHHHLAARP